MSECREVFRSLLRHDRVRGKPLLLLCNKADACAASPGANEEDDDHLDEMAVVDLLGVEREVNDARCPTRVER